MGRRSRGVDEINAGSMADIAFLLLIFFLVTTTMDVDSGILRKLPPKPDPAEPPPPPVKERNVFTVLVNYYDQLMVEDELVSVETLKESCKRFVSNPANNLNLSDKKDPEDIDLIGSYRISKGVVSLQNDRGTSYAMYIRVQNELVAAFRELRDELSMQKFGRKFKELRKKENRAIRKAIPMMISEAVPRKEGE